MKGRWLVSVLVLGLAVTMVVFLTSASASGNSEKQEILAAIESRVGQNYLFACMEDPDLYEYHEQYQLAQSYLSADGCSGGRYCPCTLEGHAPWDTPCPSGCFYSHAHEICLMQPGCYWASDLKVCVDKAGLCGQWGGTVCRWESSSSPPPVSSTVETSEGVFNVNPDQLFVAATRSSCAYVHYAIRVFPEGDFQLLWSWNEGWSASPVDGLLRPYPGGVSSAVVLLEDGTAVAVQYVAGNPAAYSIPHRDGGKWYSLP